MEKRTLFRMLHEPATAYPDRVYMKERHADGWHTASFHEVEEEASMIAGFLLSHGLARGQRVTLLSEGRNAWVTAEFGIFFAGGISVPSR
jgi:long-chain acyl-CoA synthetase